MNTKSRVLTSVFIALLALAALGSTARAEDVCCDVNIIVSPLVGCPVTINNIIFQNSTAFPGISLLPGATTTVTRPCPDSPVSASIASVKGSATILLGQLNVVVQVTKTCCVKVSLIPGEPGQCYILRINPC